MKTKLSSWSETHNNAESNECNQEKPHGNSVPFPGDPVGEVSQEDYSEDEEGEDIEQSVHPVTPTAPRFTGDDEELPAVEEDGVDLHDEGESHEGHELVGEHRDGVAEDDEAVVEQQLVGAPLAVVEDHVGRVVEEISDGEADEAVTGGGTAPLQIFRQVRCLGEMSVSAGQYSPPLPPPPSCFTS